MRKTKFHLFLLFCFCLQLAVAAVNDGELKKICFYDALGNWSAIEKNLAHITYAQLSPEKKQELVRSLAALGNYYCEQKHYAIAEKFFRKCLEIMPTQWEVYNYLQRIEHKKSGLRSFGLVRINAQFWLLCQDFFGSFLLVTNLVHSLFFSMLLVLFLFSLFLLQKYFSLAVHDIKMEKDGQFMMKKMMLVIFLLFWPILLFMGWTIYPFLILSFLWRFQDHQEKRTSHILLLGVLLLGFVFGLNRYLTRSVQQPSFKTVWQVYQGHLFPEDVYRRFDDELKTLQAYAYFSQGESDTAKKILDNTSDEYQSVLRFNLVGNLAYERGNLELSLQSYRKALQLNEKNVTILKNVTWVLLCINDAKQFDSYAARYPQIMEYRKEVHGLLPVVLNDSFLWRRVLSFSQQNITFLQLLKIFLWEWVKIPVFLFLVFFLIYRLLLDKIFPGMGESTYCSKCSRIIKKSTVGHTLRLCDECYQLFLIKDPIFFEAKIYKEKEIQRRAKSKKIMYAVISLLVPGYYWNNKEKSLIFISANWLFFSMFGYYLINLLQFHQQGKLLPLYLQLVGLLAALLYFLIAILMYQGEYDGF